MLRAFACFALQELRVLEFLKRLVQVQEFSYGSAALPHAGLQYGRQKFCYGIGRSHLK
jgi:hypothetical protein